MGSRTRALTGALILVAAALGAWTVTNLQARSEALERQEVADDLHAVGSARLERLDARAADAEQALTEDQTTVDELRRYFSPPVLAAVTRVQVNAVEEACGQARAATRDGNPLPGAEAVVDLGVATSAGPALANLDDRWASFLRPAQIQGEIDACAADEAAQIEAERQAAEAAAASAAAAAAETPIGYSECVAAVPGASGACLDLDGDGYAGYPDEGLPPTPWGRTLP